MMSWATPANSEAVRATWTQNASHEAHEEHKILESDRHGVLETHMTKRKEISHFLKNIAC